MNKVVTRPAPRSAESLLEELAQTRERLREAEETLTAIREGEVDAVVVSGRDGQQVYTLENADRPYRALIEQMQDGAVTMTEAGIILYCNERFATLAGSSYERLIGSSIAALFPDIAADLAERRLGQLLDRHASLELDLHSYDEVTRPVTLSLASVQVDPDTDPILCAVVSDQTAVHRRSVELRRSNDHLARAESSLRLALDAAEMGNWEYELESGQMLRSPQHQEIAGWPVLEATGPIEHVIAQFLPEEHARVFDMLRKVSSSGRTGFEARIARLNDGQVRWVRVDAQVFYLNGRPARLAGVIADVTHRRIVEEQLRQAQKIEAVGQLTGGVAHDFNNLLQVISGGLQLIDRVQERERREKLLKGMRQAVERGSSLSRQLLAFSRRQALHPEPIDLARQIAGMRELLDRSLRGDVHLITEFPPDLWPIEVDPGEFELVVLNLALNARDAMPTGGQITIRASNIAATTADATDLVRMDIVDNGSGMPPEVLARAFEPFFTTKGVGKGSGLGLAQAYGFAQSSGGSICIDSQVGKGTSIVLVLPRTPKIPRGIEDAWTDTVVLANSGASKGSVLLVEDDDEVASLSTEMIRELGYRITRVASAEAALGALANGRDIDIVFSDVMMPGTMDGLGLALEIKRRRPQLPVVLTSGFSECVKQQATDSGITIVAKPFRLEDLNAAFAACAGH
jgi:PAS domain S-box-containing protein